MDGHRYASEDTTDKKDGASAEQWKKRLSGLPEEVQKKISKKEVLQRLNAVENGGEK
ncbi:MAG: hypothetical protein J6K92_01965 [Oscillospiraceae bacterium]|nr:hypothetical protein [Oscillospiraceae bacterium]